MTDIIVTALRSSFPVELMVKATLVLGAAGAIALVLHRASAATRHLVWTISVVGLVLLPLLAVLLPVWEVPLVQPRAATSPEAWPAHNPISDLPSQSQLPGSSEISTLTPVANAEVASTLPAAAIPLSGPNQVPWTLLLFGLWALGTLLLLSRILVGWWALRRLARRAEVVTDPEWGQLLKDSAWMLDVSREVRLLRSSRSSMPMTWGTLRPTILLPEEADLWPDQRRRVVLLHEMAHVARRDCLTQTLADLACALYWFHPLTWVAARRLRVERERACDDRVLAAGERASDYAGHLLEVARAYRAQGGYSAAAIAMARPSQLEGRLLAVLDNARKRSAPGRRASATGIGLAALLILPLAAIRAGEAQSRPADDPNSLMSQLQEVLGTPSRALRGESSISMRVGQLLDGDGLAVDTVIDMVVPARQGGMVEIDLETGGNVRLVAWDSNAVSLHAELRGTNTQNTVVEFSSTDDVVSLTTEYSGFGNDRNSHMFELRIPALSNVEVSSSGGSVTVEGIRGTISGRTGGGNIRLNRVAGESTLRTGGGSISVTDSELEGEVATGGGNVSIVNNRGGLRGRTGGGRVVVENAGPFDTGTAALISTEPFRLSTGGGDIELRDLPGGADLSTGGGDIDLRSARGPVIARTGGGDIQIESVLGSVDATSGGGEVYLGSVAGPATVRTGGGDVRVSVADGAGPRDVDITTQGGSVTLYLPTDFSGDFEVVVQDRDGRVQDRLRSDFELSREITSNGRNATLRATGRTGTGANRVRVRASGGDVRIVRGMPAVVISRSSANSSSSSTSSSTSSSSNSSSSSSSSRNRSRSFEELDRKVETAVTQSINANADAIAAFVGDVTKLTLTATVDALHAAALSLDVDERAELSRELSREINEEFGRDVGIEFESMIEDLENDLAW